MHFDDLNVGVESGSLGIIIEKIPKNHEDWLGNQGISKTKTKSEALKAGIMGSF